MKTRDNIEKELIKTAEDDDKTTTKIHMLMEKMNSEDHFKTANTYLVSEIKKIDGLAVAVRILNRNSGKALYLEIQSKYIYDIGEEEILKYYNTCLYHNPNSNDRIECLFKAIVYLLEILPKLKFNKYRRINDINDRNWCTLS